MSTPTPPAASRPRLDYLDALRGLAALIVLVFHISEVAPPSQGAIIQGIHQWVDLGQLGVGTFFIISGYVIALSLDRTPPALFWRQRAFRLYPTYWLSILLIVILVALDRARPASLQFDQSPLLVTLANATMVQSLFGIDNMIGVYWTLFFELLFYIFASSLWRLGLARHSVGAACAWFVVALIVDRSAPLLGLPPTRSLSLFGLMLTGHVLYREQLRQVSSYQAYAVVLLCGALFLAIGTPMAMAVGRCMALACFVACRRWRWHPAPLVWLGMISYPLYLLHEIVIAGLGSRAAPLDALLWLGGSILVAWAVHRWVERPAMRLAKRGPAKSAAALPVGGSE